MLKGLLSKERRNRGFTMTEILTVIGIIVIIVAIAVPSVIMINNNTRFKQCNEYAQVIFTAAQNNLTQMRSDGRLDQLGTNLPPAQTLQRQDFPASGIVYTYNGQPDFNLVLPADAVENTLRDETIIIEYNPKTGVIFSAFYSEDEGILERYQNGSLKLDADIRKKEKVGYYPNPDPDDIVLGDAAMESYTIEGSALAFENGEAEGVLTMSIPVSVGTDTVLHSRNYKQLAVKLTVTGEISGNVVTKTINVADLNLQQGDSATIVDNKVQISCVLDSLDGGQFVGFDVLMDENGAAQAILPGENVTIVAQTTFNQEEDDPQIIVPDFTLAKVNPMFHALEAKELKVSNARNLLNLSLVAEDVAKTLDAVSFVSGIGNEAATPIIRMKDVAFKPIVNPSLFGAIDKSDAQASQTTQVSVKGNGVMIYGLTINDPSEYNAGLFASLNVPVDGINLVNPAISGGIRAGALAGATGPQAAITGCRVVIDKTDSGWSNTVSYGIKGEDIVGGLVGDVYGSTISGCEVAIPVSGEAGDNTTEGFGGIAGVAQNATLEKSTVRVNGTAVNGTFGGVVGTALEKMTIKDMTVTVGGSILGTPAETEKKDGVAAENIGGLVGISTGELSVDDSEVTLKAIDTQKGIAMSGDNVAGLVCTAQKLVMNKTTVNIEDSIEGKKLAAGAVCETGKDSNITDVTVRLGFIDVQSSTNDKWEARRIDGDKQVAGFACLLKGTVKNCTVAGKGTIGSTTSDLAAGFAVTVGASNETTNKVENCRVIPAYDVNSNTFKFLNNTNYGTLEIFGSGFASENYAQIKNCTAVGTVKDNGFVTNNNKSGKIEKSVANVDGTKAFAQKNEGEISYCYGWTDEAVKEVSGTVKSSYFADMTGGVLLYDTTGAKQESGTAALTDESTLELLDGATEAAARTWKLSMANKTYAFAGVTTAYPYPMVQAHYGSWAEVEEACGVLYYEKYEDGSYGVETMNLSDAAPLPFSKDNKAVSLSEDKKIAEAGYALFCKKDTKPFAEATNKLMGALIEAEDLHKAANLDDRYGIYVFAATGEHTLTGPAEEGATAKTVKVNAAYAAAFNVTNNTYRIRTADQFKAIGSTGTYKLERDLAVGNTAITTFSGTLDGNNKTITVDGSGSLIGALTGGKVSNLTVKGSINVAGVTTSVGGVFGKVTGGTVENVTSQVTFTGTAGSGKVGMFVGEATSGTFVNCHSTAANTKYPFGHIASTDESVSGNPTHTSKEKLADGQHTDVTNLEAVGTTVTKKKFAATFDNCTFKLADTTTNALVEDAYFYEVTKVYTPVDAYKQVAAPTYTALNATADWTKTAYFVLEGSIYQPLYVKTVVTTSEVEGVQTTQTNYEFGTDGSTAKWTSEVIADPAAQVAIEGLTFCQQVEKVETGIYRLVTTDASAPAYFSSDWNYDGSQWTPVDGASVSGSIKIQDTNNGTTMKMVVDADGKQYICTLEKLSDSQNVKLVDTGYKVAGLG